MTGPPPSHVVVLGGGITGLSSAFHLARRLPKSSRITILERTNRVGGWIKSHPLHGNNIALEAGPRTLRGGGLALMELINQLNLQTSLVTSSKTSQAARSRYLFMEQYDPPLTLIPPAPAGLLMSSRLRWGLWSMLKEPFRRPNRPPDIEDESIESFITRRISPEFAQTFISAFIHGIFAADARKLSVKAVFPVLWRAEELGGGSFLFGMRKAGIERQEMTRKKMKEGKYQSGCLPEQLRDVSVFSFKGGMETMIHALEDRLSEAGNVEVKLEVACKRLLDDKETGGFQIDLSTGETLQASHVISTIPLPALHAVLHPDSPTALPSSPRLPHLLYNPAADVQVLNLVFPPCSAPIHPPGFGYLVPRPKTGGYPFTPYTSESDSQARSMQNVLGTIFDSSLVAEHDHTRDPTVLTIMMGGPFPLMDVPTGSSGNSGAPASESTHLHPSELDPFVRTLTRHLSPSQPIPTPTTNALHTHRKCIPTYLPGHVERMKDLVDTLEDRRGEWRGRMKVVGAGVGGPGVGDCIDAGRKAAFQLAEQHS